MFFAEAVKMMNDDVLLPTSL